MKEFVHIYPWFPHMLSMILANGLSYVKDIDSPLEKLSTKDAEKLGKALSVSLLTNTYVLPGGEIGRGTKDGWSEGRLERSDNGISIRLFKGTLFCARFAPRIYRLPM